MIYTQCKVRQGGYVKSMYRDLTFYKTAETPIFIDKNLVKEYDKSVLLQG